jgi:hypothetical protein
MLHEYGASSAQYAPERIAAYDRLLSWSALGGGAIGFYAWYWTDAEPAAFRRAPYVRMPHETQFGVTEHAGVLRPRGRVLGQLAQTLTDPGLDLVATTADGPWAVAAISVPQEYAHPYDPAGFGLDGAASGAYRPAERDWYPDRVVATLVRGRLNAIVLADRAGIAGLPPRDLDDAPPDAALLLPAPLTTSTNSLWHVRTGLWDRLPELTARGGVVYLSCSAETAIPELARLAGVRILDRAPVTEPTVLKFVEPWGAAGPGDVIRIPAGGADPHLRGVLLEPLDARVVAVDGAGRPALTCVDRGTGAVVVCGYPIELLLAGIEPPIRAHHPRPRRGRAYRPGRRSGRDHQPRRRLGHRAGQLHHPVRAAVGGPGCHRDLAGRPDHPARARGRPADLAGPGVIRHVSGVSGPVGRTRAGWTP